MSDPGPTDAAAAITVRPGVLDDCVAIAAIYRPEVLDGTATFELDPPSADAMRERLDELRLAGYPVLMAADATGVIGYAYAAPFRSRPAFRSTVEVSIYVARAAQGRGVGRLLLDALIDTCARQGFRQMLAVIGDPERQRPSVKLHSAAGFTETGRLPAVGFKHGRWLDCLVMQRALGEASQTAPNAESVVIRPA